MIPQRPLVSVLAPVYNGAAHLQPTIESVLAQTYENFEFILANDASTDDSEGVIKRFSDSRIRYIRHDVNLGAQAARKTAFAASRGELIAYLDQDDLFHPEKLDSHVGVYRQAPETGLTYNGHYEFQGSPSNVRGLMRPPERVTLADLFLGFPICPSDMVCRREWSARDSRAEDSTHLFHGGEIAIFGKLFMDGCVFASVDRALNYRRLHSGRRVSNLQGNFEGYLRAQQAVLDDPRCSDDVRGLGTNARAGACVVWACYALAQGERELGGRLCHEAVSLSPELVQSSPSELAARFSDFSLDDESKDPEEVLRTMFANLPADLSSLQRDLNWALWRAHLLRGARAFVWAGDPDASKNLRAAAAIRSELNAAAVQAIGRQLLDYEYVYGAAATDSVIDDLAKRLHDAGFKRCDRRVKALHSMNRAFRDFEGQRFDRVPEQAMSAMAHRPEYMLDRGAWSISLRSLTGMLRRRLGGNLVSNA